MDRIEVAKRLGLFYQEISPQVIDGSLQYYLSGSLASMILGSAEEITEVELDENNNIVGEREPKKILEEQRRKIQLFSRQLGGDVDVVDVNGHIYYGSTQGNRPDRWNVGKHVPEAYELMGWIPGAGGTMYLDYLEEEREIDHHPVVRVRTNEGDIYVTAPPELLAHKISETMYYTRRVLTETDERKKEKFGKKYEKDIRDTTTMFIGFYKMYGAEFLERVFTALAEKRGGQFFVEENENPKVQEYYEQSLIRKMKEDCMSLCMELGELEASFEIEKFFDELMKKRRKMVEEKRQGTGKEIV